MANRALIIANQTFADPLIPALASPISDGRRLKALLERDDVGGYDVDLRADAGSVDARLAVQEFFGSGEPDDLQLLVVSSHGLKDGWSRLYFATADTRQKHAAAASLDPRFIREQMDDGAAGRKVLIVDACYSGAVVDGVTFKRAGAAGISQADFGDLNVAGTTVITASSKIQLAGERNVDGSMQSVFTRCMIEGIETGAAATDGGGVITLSALYDYVCRRLRTEAPGQTPQWLNTSHGGAIVIARNPAYQAVALPDELVARTRSRDRFIRITAAEDLEDIAKSNGREAELARAELERLTVDDSIAVKQVAQIILGRLQQPAAAAAGEKVVSVPADVQPPAQTILGRVQQPAAAVASDKVVPPTVGMQPPEKPDRTRRGPMDFIRRWSLLTKLLVSAGVVAALAVAIIAFRPVPSVETPDTGVSAGEQSEDKGQKDYAAKDFSSAQRDFKAACDGGDARGCTDLGVMYQNAEGVARDMSRAYELYVKGCNGDNMLGCFDLGTLFAAGKGVPQDKAHALQLYQKACDGGQIAGCNNAGLMFEHADGVAEDYHRAFELYDKACDGGDGAGCTNLGTLYTSGKGAPQNLARAIELFGKACDGNDGVGCYNLGIFYNNGRGVTKDVTKAADLFQKACDKDSPEGCTNLGGAYDDGNGRVKDYRRAVDSYRKGCDQDNADGCAFLAEKYEYGRGVSKDMEKAISLYRRAMTLDPTLKFAEQGLSRLGQTH